MDILDNELFDKKIQRYYEASKGKRITNYFIDYSANTIVALLFWIFFGFLLSITLGENDALALLEGESIPSFLFQLVISSLLSIAFYTAMEFYSKGKSLGKLITKTRAVQRSGEHLTFEKALKRSACRLIPFEGFSYLGEVRNGLHDSIPGTMVIDENLPIQYSLPEDRDSEFRKNSAKEVRLK